MLKFNLAIALFLDFRGEGLMRQPIWVILWKSPSTSQGDGFRGYWCIEKKTPR